MLGKSAEVIKNISPFIFKKENSVRIGLSLALSSVNIGLNLVSPYILSEAFSKLSSKEELEVLGVELNAVELTALFGITWGLSRFTGTLRKLLINRIAARGVKDLLSKFSKHLMQLSLEYHVTTPPATFFEIENKCYQGVPDLISELFQNIVPTTLEVLLASAILSILYGPVIGFSLLGVLTIYTGYNILTASTITSAQNECMQVGFRTHALFDAIVKNYETVHCFNNTELELRKLDDNYSQFENAIEKKMSAPDKVALGQLFIAGVGLTLLIVLMGYQVSKGNFAIEDFVIICNYLLLFSSPLATFGEAVNKARASITDLETIFNFFQIQPRVTDVFPGLQLATNRANADIKFNNVTFGYEGSPLILNKATFHIPAGKKTAIVGFSGAGKTTISKLLYRFYEVMSGDILINNQSILLMGLNPLRAAMGIVPQKPVVFNDTIYKNVEYGGLSQYWPNRPPREKVIAAIRAACMDEWIAGLPEGLNTLIGENGKKISGGQLQRLAIARAILKEPFIYILDEATSSLDSVTENEIQNNFDNISKGVTTLVISHRLSTIVNADKIIVLHEGKLIEEGTHNELLANQNLYAHLWREQSSSYKKKLSIDEFDNAEDKSVDSEFKLIRKRENKAPQARSEIGGEPQPLLPRDSQPRVTVANRPEVNTLFFSAPVDDKAGLLSAANNQPGEYGSIQRDDTDQVVAPKNKCSIV